MQARNGQLGGQRVGTERTAAYDGEEGAGHAHLGLRGVADVQVSYAAQGKQ